MFYSPHRCKNQTVHLINFVQTFAIVTGFFLVSFSEVMAREISFLPTYIIGDSPVYLQKKDNVSEGLSDLIAFYAKENFEVDTSDSDKLRNFLESMEETPEKKASRELISGVCGEFESDYVVKSEMDFSGDPVIQTITYNCKGKPIYTTESVLQGDFYLGIEKHVLKTFTYLSPKRKKNRDKYKDENIELIYAIDLSGSLAKDAETLLGYIKGLIGSDTSIGLVLIGDKDVKVVKPSRDHEKLKAEIGRIRFGGEISIEKLTSSLIKVKGELAFGTNKNRRFILVTDAQAGDGDPYKLVSTLQSIAQIGFQTFLVTGSYFDYKMTGTYRKAARSTGQDLQQIMHFIKVGTMKGYKTIYLYDRKVYIDPTGKINPSDLDFKELVQIPEGTLYKLVSFPHPNNLVDLFIGYTGEKVIEQGQVSSNISTVIDRLTNENTKEIGKVNRKVLIKVGGKSIWMPMKTISEQYIDQDVGIRAVFKKQFNNSNGYINIPEETVVYKDTVPLLLVLEPNEIKNYLYNSNKDFVVCFIKGKILEIK